MKVLEYIRKVPEDANKDKHLTLLELNTHARQCNSSFCFFNKSQFPYI